MKIGIISECQGEIKANVFLKFIKARKLKKEYIFDEMNGIEIVAIQAPYTVEEMFELQERRLRLFMNNAIETLKSEGVKKAVYTKGIKKVYSMNVEDRNFEIVDGTDVFYDYVPNLVKKLSEKCNIDKLRAKLGISDMALGMIAENIMSKLCYDAKYVNLYTQNSKKANEVCEKISEDMGLDVNILDYKNARRRKDDIFVDLTERKVRVGRDIIIDGIELDFDTGVYDVSSLDIAKCLNRDVKNFKIKYYTCGKNKLTL